MRGPLEFTYDTLAKGKGKPTYVQGLKTSSPAELKGLGRVHLFQTAMGVLGTPEAFEATRGGSFIDVESTSRPALARGAELVLNTAWNAPGAVLTLAFASMAVEGAVGYVRTRRRRNQLCEGTTVEILAAGEEIPRDKQLFVSTPEHDADWQQGLADDRAANLEAWIEDPDNEPPISSAAV